MTDIWSGDEKVADVEKGAGAKKSDNRPPTDEIIPVYRRDCHEEVYCGSHTYPGQGVYLLKFDNSYSLWRSKTLYYRVYYSRWTVRWLRACLWPRAEMWRGFNHGNMNASWNVNWCDWYTMRDVVEERVKVWCYAGDFCLKLF